MARWFAFLLLFLHGALAQKIGIPWQTLSGDAPMVIARGGYSGLFPESTSYAYEFALSTSLQNVALFCDLQLLKDGAGLCRTDLRLENSTNVADAFPKGAKTYSVNGEKIQGWFSVDFTSADLFKKHVSGVQNVLSRPSLFDNSLPFMLLDDVVGVKPPKLWINVQYGMFFKQQGFDMGTYIIDSLRFFPIDYVSSPEIGFLKGLKGKMPKTKLVFRFLDEDAVEPSTKQSYGSILKDLKSIAAFASGILVPKNYIWPVGGDQYLQDHTSLAQEAHEQGLEVFASGFANDSPGSYNYSYDPTAEYLKFIDNSEFSVDGVLTDFPSTASESIACFAHMKNSTTPIKGKPLVITHNGASGIYAGSTDLAYQKAIEDGADIIDCSVQLSKDGVPFCRDSIDLMGDTTVMTTFMSRASTVPEIQQNSGVFSFDLTWSEIQTLKPQLSSPLAEGGLLRNPAFKNQGKIMALSDFLDFAKDKAVPGILVNIQNAAFLASKKGLDLVDAVDKALIKAGYSKQSTQQVLIQSDDSSVLSKFTQCPSYKRVLSIQEVFSTVPKPILQDIKSVADAVNLPRASLLTHSEGFLADFTQVVRTMHSGNISVYVSVIRNEFMSLAFDYLSDPTIEICTLVSGLQVDGVITEFPGTASQYLRSPCFNPGEDVTYPILPVEAGSLLGLAPPDALPPADPPAPALEEASVIDPPLPPVADVEAREPTPAPATHPSGQTANSINVVSSLVLFVLTFVSLRHH